MVAAANLPPTFCVNSKNYTELHVVLYKLNPHTDLKKWYGLDKSALPKKEGEYLPFGEKVFDKVVPVEGFMPDTETLVPVDLTPALAHADLGVGQVGIVVMPTKKAQYPINYFYFYLFDLIQVTLTAQKTSPLSVIGCRYELISCLIFLIFFK